MDTQVLEIIKSLADNALTTAILAYIAYRLAVALKSKEEAEKQAINRYIEHLEAFHPSPTQDDN